MAEQPQVVEGQHRTASINVGGPARDYYVQLPYRLSELEFWILTKGRSKFDTLAFAFLTGAAIALINAVTKLWLAESVFTAAELVSPVLIALAGAAIYGLGRLLPNEHRRLLSKIKKHFDTNPSVGASMDMDDGQ